MDRVHYQSTTVSPRRRRRATYKRPHGVRHLLAAYDLSTDRLYGHIEPKKDRPRFRTFLRYVRSLHPEDVRIAIVLDNFSPHISADIRTWAAEHNVEAAFVPSTPRGSTPSRPSSKRCANFAIDGTDHESHEAQARIIRRYIAWRNRNPTTRHFVNL